ncbi:hypothetical protein GCM10028778_12380 [Barrientosiimonas marina]|uniref:GNAT family N-acetyltransferase n=1 Tax=Lentibacillus kimchii TaxID=1542911 RepID=A0ABW2UTE6_9BACI
MESFDIHMLPREAHTDAAEMEHITDLVNRAFARAEKGVMKPWVVRTTVEDVTKLTSDGELAVARSNGQTIGCVRVRQLDSETEGLGMLAVDEAFQGTGAGRALVRFAEQRCQSEQLPKMQLEMLMPREGSYPGKVSLKNWYSRMGYQQADTHIIDDSFPELMKELDAPSKFIVFQKELG